MCKRYGLIAGEEADALDVGLNRLSVKGTV